MPIELRAAEPHSAEPHAAEPALKLIAVTDAGPVYLQPLEAPGNPYAGQYSELDQWVYANATLMSDAEFQVQYGSGPDARALAATRPEGWMTQIAYASAEGYILPTLEQQRIQREAFERDSPHDWVFHRYNAMKDESAFPGLHKFYSAGVMEQTTREALQQAWSTDIAEWYPTIPAWLGENPPLHTIFVPNGEILCVGPLGLRFIEDEKNRWYFDTRGLLWYRYSREGRLLGTYDFGEAFGSEWMMLYWPQMRETLNSPLREGTSRHYSSGTVSMVRYKKEVGVDYSMGLGHEPEAIVACFDYDGTELNPMDSLPLERRRMGSKIAFEQLAQVYQTQLAQGRTSTDSRSPYAGTAEGPQVTDSTPRPFPLVAGGQYRGQDRSLEECIVTDGKPRHWAIVRPLDDPANPYKDDYGPWDAWLYANIGKNNPRIEAARQQLWAQQSDLRNLLQKEKRKPTEEEQKLLNQHGIAIDQTDPWQHFTLQVDTQGWLLPYVKAKTDQLESMKGYDLRSERSREEGSDSFQIQAGGVMEAGMAGEMLRAEYAAGPYAGLQIPAWLIEQPVEHAMMMPNGDIVTIGPLNSYDPSPDITDYKARTLPSFERTYFRYSASGELLGSLPMEAGPISALYDQSLIMRYQQATATGLQWEQRSCINILRDKTTKEAVEAYDWDGTPLDLSQPIYGHGPYCQRMHYAEQKGVWEAHQS